jgi:hypothetical protein
MMRGLRVGGVGGDGKADGNEAILLSSWLCCYRSPPCRFQKTPTSALAPVAVAEASQPQLQGPLRAVRGGAPQQIFERSVHS